MKVHAFRLLLVVVGLFVSVLASAETKNDKVNWLSIQQDGYTLKYQAGDEELAKKILPEIVKQRSAANAEGTLSEMTLAAQKRKELLAAIATEVGIKKPTKEMSNMFDSCVKALLPIEKFLSSCRVFELDRDDDVNASASFGYYSSIKDFGFELRDSGGVKKLDLESILSKRETIPISLGKVAQGSDLDKALKDLGSMKEVASVGIICHEVSEGHLVMGLKLEGAFRRWFTDGVATYIAFRVVGDVLGKASADRFILTSFPTGAETLQDQIDLEGWRACEWDDAMPFTDAKLTSACYAYSYKEISELVGRHGVDTIRRVCAEIASSKDRPRDRQTILNAIKKVTGEDMHQVLSKYGAKCEDKFRGIAIKDLAIRSFAVKSRRLKMGGETDSIRAIDKEDEGIVVGFRADALDRPAGYNLWMRYGPNSRFASWETNVSNLNKGGNQQFVVMPIQCFYLSHYSPGDYKWEIECNGKVLKEMTIKVVAP